MFFRVFYYGFGGLDDRFMVLLSPMLEQMALDGASGRVKGEKKSLTCARGHFLPRTLTFSRAVTFPPSVVVVGQFRIRSESKTTRVGRLG
jgi:hypothetical protein